MVVSSKSTGETIADYVARESVDLVVMGTKGKGWRKEQALGSTASYVIEHTTVPVMVVK